MFYSHPTNAQICTYIWKYLHMCSQVHFPHMLLHRQITHSHTKQSTAINPNQTAMSHTVTVATVVGSMQNTFCHISGGFFSLSLSLCHTHTHRHNQLSATVIPVPISQVDRWIKHWGVQVWQFEVIVQIFIIEIFPKKMFFSSSFLNCICVPVILTMLTTVR